LNISHSGIDKYYFVSFFLNESDFFYPNQLYQVKPRIIVNTTNIASIEITNFREKSSASDLDMDTDVHHYIQCLFLFF
jgi:hypothetical protein